MSGPNAKASPIDKLRVGLFGERWTGVPFCNTPVPLG